MSMENEGEVTPLPSPLRLSNHCHGCSNGPDEAEAEEEEGGRGGGGGAKGGRKQIIQRRMTKEAG